MKHTTEELLFAAAVRERVGALRLAKIKDMTKEERAAFDLQSINPLIEEVMQEFDGFAKVIASIRSREEPRHQ